MAYYIHHLFQRFVMLATYLELPHEIATVAKTVFVVMHTCTVCFYD